MEFDVRALDLVARDQGVSVDEVIAIVEVALTEAYRKGGGADPQARAHLTAAGHLAVVNAAGDDVTPPGFGTRAAAAARQALVAWLRDLDRVRKVGPWAGREGTVGIATVRGHGRAGETRFTVDGVEAVMPAGEAISSESLHVGQSVHVLILAVNATERGSVRLTVSRRQPALLTAFLSAECPAVRTGDVEIVSVVREPGQRSKIAFRGALDLVLGPAGRYMRALSAAVSPEVVDLVEHDEDITEYVRRAVSARECSRVEVAADERGVMLAHVPTERSSVLAGRGGTNLRLASKLTGTKIRLVAD